MIEVLKAHIVSHLGNDIHHLDTVLDMFTPCMYQRNDLVLREGDICKHVYFIVEGALQVFVHDENMNETTRDIVVENAWCSELMSFGSGNPSSENIRAIEATKLLAINKQDFMLMMEQVPQFDKVYRRILEISYANSVYRLNTFVALSALERIKWLLNNRPALMTRFSSKLIASYLGINKDVFSRLKAQL